MLLLLLLIGMAEAVTVNGPLNGAQWETCDSDPTGITGRICYNTTEKRLRIYDGAAWISSYRVPWIVNYRISAGINFDVTALDTDFETFSEEAGATGGNVLGYTLGGFITCSGTEVASGTSCTAEEQVGVSFVSPYAAKVMLCASVNVYSDTNSASEDVQAKFKFCETPNNAQTCSEDGETWYFRAVNISTSAKAFFERLETCSVFDIGAGQVTFRLFKDNDSANATSLPYVGSYTYIKVVPLD